jgi:hypothetical protein
VGGQSNVIPSQGGKSVRFTQGSGSSIRPSWSHDGKWIYYCASENNGPQIWKKAAAGGPEIQVTTSGGCDQLESPDGAYVYYLKPDSRSLWRLPTGGGVESEVLSLTHVTDFVLGSHGAYLMKKVGPAALRYLDFGSGGISVLGVVTEALRLIVDWPFRPTNIGCCTERPSLRGAN